MQCLNFDEVIQRITRQDARYHKDAYSFLREGLDYTQKRLSDRKKSEPRHVSGEQLLQGLRDFALSQFGPMAKTVLNEWGIQSCEDFGELVFNMVDQGLLSKTDTDSRDDFKPGFNFEEAFCKPFLPRTRVGPKVSPETKAGPN